MHSRVPSIGYAIKGILNTHLGIPETRMETEAKFRSTRMTWTERERYRKILNANAQRCVADQSRKRAKRHGRVVCCHDAVCSRRNTLQPLGCYDNILQMGHRNNEEKQTEKNFTLHRQSRYIHVQCIQTLSKLYGLV